MTMIGTLLPRLTQRPAPAAVKAAAPAAAPAPAKAPVATDSIVRTSPVRPTDPALAAEIRKLVIENARLAARVDGVRREVARDLSDFKRETDAGGILGNATYWLQRFERSRSVGNQIFGALYDDYLDPQEPFEPESAERGATTDPEQRLEELMVRNAELKDTIGRAKRALDRGKPAWVYAGKGGTGDAYYWVARYEELRTAGIRRLEGVKAALGPAY